jgi:hypothetical protein
MIFHSIICFFCRLIGVLLVVCSVVAYHRGEGILGDIACAILGVMWFRLPTMRPPEADFAEPESGN